MPIMLDILSKKKKPNMHTNEKKVKFYSFYMKKSNISCYKNKVGEKSNLPVSCFCLFWHHTFYKFQIENI